MTRTALWRLGCIFAAFALLVSACGSDDDSSSGDDTSTEDGGSGDEASSDGPFIDPELDCDTNYDPTVGVEGDTIKIGTIRPAAGTYAIYDIITQGLQMWVDATNADGGITAGDGNTYQLELVKGDDQYDPSRTPDEAKRLVEQEGIFAMVGQIGTANNLAVRDYMNDNCVPSIGLATGSTNWGDAFEYPWYLSGLPSYALEAHAFVEWLKMENPSASIALLYQDDDFGQAYKDTLESEIEGTDLTIADSAPFNPLSETSTEGKVAQLANSDADVFFVGIGGTPCPSSLGFVPDDWDPITYISVTCASNTALGIAQGNDEGVYTIQPTLDAADPDDATNPKVVEFLADGAALGVDEGTLKGGIALPGYNFGALFGAILENTPEVTRHDLMNTAFSLDGVEFGLLRDGITATTNGDEDPWVIESMRMVQRVNGQWDEVLELQDFEGTSNDYVG